MTSSSMKKYRIELFDRVTLAFRSFAEISEPDIHLDALCQTNSTVEAVGQIDVIRGDFAQIRIDGKVYFQGIVKDWNYDGNKTELTINQMSALLDTEVFADVELLKTQSIEKWMSDLITATFAGDDSFQNLPNLSIVRNSETSGTHTASNDGTYNMYDLSVSFFKVYGVCCRISFDFTSRTVRFAFNTPDQSATKLSLNITDVSSYSIEPSNTADSVNKIIIRNQDDHTETETFYWHPTEFSGTVDTDSTHDRVLPVVTGCEQISLQDGEVFADAAYNKAYETLYSTRYDDLIQVTFKATSKLLSVGDIGTLFILYADGNVYNTILTGIHTLNMEFVELTFGYVRKRLTQILKMKGI